MALCIPLLYITNPEYFLVNAVVIALLLSILLTDWMVMLILNKTLLLFAVPILLLRWLYPLPGGIIDSLLGAAGGFVIMLILAILSKGQVGGGDVKLYALIGFIFGWNGVLLNIFLSCILALLGGFMFVILRKRTKRDAIPFGPYIAFASALMLLIPL